MNNPLSPDIETAFEGYEATTRETLEAVRDLVFQVVSEHAEIGPVTETLKWGEPAYLTEKTKSGSTLRLGQTRVDKQPALFVNCKTDLIAQFRELYPDQFIYDGVRAMILADPPEAVCEELKHCIALTLTYHLRKAR